MSLAAGDCMTDGQLLEMPAGLQGKRTALRFIRDLSAQSPAAGAKRAGRLGTGPALKTWQDFQKFCRALFLPRAVPYNILYQIALVI